MTDKDRKRIINIDTIVLWLLTTAYLSNWEKLFSLSGGLKTWGDSYRSVPIIKWLLPINDNLLFDPYRWIMVCVIVGSLMVYTLLDFLAEKQGEKTGKAKLVIIIVITAFIVLLPTFKEIVARQQVGTWTHANDNVIQTERAIELLLEGKDFYHEDYLDSDLALFQDSYKNPKEHPVLYHYVYLPSDTVMSVPLYLIIKKILGWYDQRFMYLLLFIISMWLVLKIIPKGTIALVGLTAYALNPFTVPFIIEGRNDIFTLFWVISAIYLFSRNKSTPAWGILALACAHKQFAWFLLPFVFVFAGRLKSFSRQAFIEAWRQQRNGIYAFSAIFILFVGPFLLWHPADFFDDILAYGMGLSSASMPIEGPRAFGFGTVVLYRAWVDNWNDSFPFWLFQALTVLPLLYFALRKQIKENRIAVMVVGSTLVMLVFVYFSRFLHDNHIGYATSLLIIAYMMDAERLPHDACRRE